MERYLIDQQWSGYTDVQHAIWRQLFHRQQDILVGRVVPEFLEGVSQLGLCSEKIPDFAILNEFLRAKTGWEIVTVTGLVPDDLFFQLLADRKFPSGHFIREPHQLDYIEEPDIFHDVYGHAPLLINPVFANYMQAYGQAGLAACGKGHLHRLARLYWYTVEFGLIDTPQGLRTYGAGIVSSYTETQYCLENPKPNRLIFDLKRVMRTDYRIDDFQDIYFVIPNFDILFEQTTQNLASIYEQVAALPDFSPQDLTTDDQRY